METETVALDFLVKHRIEPEIEAKMEEINRKLEELESDLERLISERKRKHQKSKRLKGEVRAIK